jgi:hypothetical protein
MNMPGVRQSPRKAGALLLGLTLLAGALPAGTQQAALPELNQQLEPLRSRFNADTGKVRLILLLDPT